MSRVKTSHDEYHRRSVLRPERRPKPSRCLARRAIHGQRLPAWTSHVLDQICARDADGLGGVGGLLVVEVQPRWIHDTMRRDGAPWAFVHGGVGALLVQPRLPGYPRRPRSIPSPLIFPRTLLRFAPPHRDTLVAGDGERARCRDSGPPFETAGLAPDLEEHVVRNVLGRLRRMKRYSEPGDRRSGSASLIEDLHCSLSFGSRRISL